MSFRVVGICILVAALGGTTASAQQYGQWSWDAVLSAGQQNHANSIQDERIGEYDHSEARLGLGLNGFIIHPNFTKFRLELYSWFDKYGGPGSDSRRLGGAFRFEILPRGNVPVVVAYSHRNYNYLDVGPDSPSGAYGGLPDTFTMFDALVRVRKGFLRGLAAGINHASIDFLDSNSRNQVNEREYVDWMSGGTRLQHHYRLERRFLAYRQGSTTENYVATLEEHGLIGREWRWDLTALGIHRRFGTGRKVNETNTIRIRNRFSHRFPGEDRLELVYNGGLGGTTGFLTSASSHQVSAYYRFRRWEDWEVAPFASILYQTADDIQRATPQLGVSAVWRKNFGPTGLSVTGSVAHGPGVIAGDKTEQDAESTSMSFNAVVRHGRENRLQKSFEIQWSRNEFVVAGDDSPDQPDTGIDFTGQSISERNGARLSLNRRWSRVSFHVYADWRHDEFVTGLDTAPLSSQSLAGGLNLNWSTLSFQGSLRETTIESLTKQEVRSLWAGLVWRPWNFLQLRGTYSEALRDVVFGPQLNDTEIRLGTVFELGLFDLKATVWERVDEIQDGNFRTNRGFTWAISRRFGGWLPIVSAPQRRGVIR